MSREGRARAVLEWARGCPECDGLLSLNGGDAEPGSFSVSTGYTDAALTEYIDGSADREYRFSLNVIGPWSPGMDGVNAEAMEAAERFMDWCAAQYPGNVPDMGERCEVTGIEPLYGAPALVQVYPDGQRAKYQFQASIYYTERKEPSWLS